MELLIYNHGNYSHAELKDKNLVFKETQDILDLMANAGYLGADRILLKIENLPEGFFNLKTGIAGEVLQKFSNYNQRLAIVGNFSEFKSKSLHDFIYESNKTGRVIFVSSKEKVFEFWQKG
ncbi:MAG: DUF4180 domain-containing protein [Prolixibacteraceae bacterium]|nr:DUF4180 domain-containing protein [Prolixibacteraceae bacterium]